MRRHIWKGLLAVWLALGISASARSVYLQDTQQPAQTQAQPTPPAKKDKAQSKDKDKDKDKQGPKNDTGSAPAGGANTGTNTGSGEPKPLFGGTLNLKSSRQSKDSATLGFNGLDPNGQVQKAFLASAATGADTAKVQQMAKASVTPDEIVAFVTEGNLNQQAAPSHTGEKK